MIVASRPLPMTPQRQGIRPSGRFVLASRGQRWPHASWVIREETRFISAGGQRSPLRSGNEHGREIFLHTNEGSPSRENGPPVLLAAGVSPSLALRALSHVQSPTQYHPVRRPSS